MNRYFMVVSVILWSVAVSAKTNSQWQKILSDKIDKVCEASLYGENQEIMQDQGKAHIQCGTHAVLQVSCDDNKIYHLYFFEGQKLKEYAFNLKPNKRKHDYIKYIGKLENYDFIFKHTVNSGMIVLLQSDDIILGQTDLKTNNFSIVQKIPYSVHCNSATKCTKKPTVLKP
ncbi:MAG: hypothetical protein JW841_05245 [Deltaproteobacteria bacterium]|nr:hypothetical protein [Deltaproteobacteria bacterium]